jgi:hypothetical protein
VVTPQDRAPNTLPILSNPVTRDQADLPLMTRVEGPTTAVVGEQQLATVEAELTALTRDLADRLLNGAFRDMEATLFEQVSNKLRDELPELIEQVLRTHLNTGD